MQSTKTLLTALATCGLIGTANAEPLAQFDLGTSTSPVATDWEQVVIAEPDISTTATATQNGVTILLTASTVWDARSRGGNPDGIENGESDEDALYRDWFFDNNNSPGDTATVEFTGLNPGGQYNITAYHFESSGGQEFFTTDWYENSTTGSLVGSWDGERLANFDEGDSVELSTLTADGSGKITLVAEATEGPLRLNGFDISVVPEPSSLALMAMGGICVLRRRR